MCHRAATERTYKNLREQGSRQLPHVGCLSSQTAFSVQLENVWTGKLTKAVDLYFVQTLCKTLSI